MSTQGNLSLKYSSGVSQPSFEIAADGSAALKYAPYGNLAGVISSGTVVLGLGNIRALASKPVMKGKADQFKKFSGIYVFDLEVDEADVKKFCDVVASLESTFGSINLEYIKAPEFFAIKDQLRSPINTK